MPCLEEPVEAQYVHRALAQAHDRYTKRNPKSLEAHLAAHSSLPGGNTRTVLHAAPFPLTWKYGEDARLTSLDDTVYIDLLGEFSAGIFGHSDARIAHAVKVALLSGWNYGGNSVVEKEFARIVCQRFGPSGVDLVRFTNSGTEANTTCLAAAVALTGRKKILVFSGGYHGSTLVFPKTLMKGSPPAPTMNLPHEFVYAPYNNIEETKKIVAHLPNESALAAILVEPVQGSAGCRPATKEFMLYLRELATETGAFLVIDEVMASRLGVSGYSATMGIKGDFVTLGKYVGGGMTFGAFGGRRDIMEKFDPAKNMLFHPGTYNNNVVTMNAGIEGLRIFDASEVSRLNGLGDSLKRAVQELFIKQGLYPESITDPSTDLFEIDSLESDDVMQAGDSNILGKAPPMFITSKGSMLNIRFSGPNAAAWQSLFYHHNLANGINIAVRGYTPMNICLSEDDVEKYVSAIKSFVLEHQTELLRDQN
jgi:glutamate-1-semialdehyde 2,1-aminomutase